MPPGPTRPDKAHSPVRSGTDLYEALEIVSRLALSLYLKHRLSYWRRLVLSAFYSHLCLCSSGSTISGPVFCPSLGVSSDYAQRITGQVTEATFPVIG